MGDNKGSSLVYVILFITLMSIFSTGYLAISRYNMQSTLESRSYTEARMTAKTMHRTFCQSLSGEDSNVMDCIRQCFEADCAAVREQYDEMTADGSPDGEEPDENGGTGGRWERYLSHALGNKEYVIKGKGKSRDGVEADITVKAKPLSGYVNVTSRLRCNGYHFSMKADITFDHGGGLPSSSSFGYRSGDRDSETSLEGNAAYLYYEDGEP